MSDTSATPAVRLVPGAPPPPPVSKSQKKKRKTAAMKKTASEQSEGTEHVVVPDATASALIEQAPTENDIKEGTVAADLVAQPTTPAAREVSPLLDDKESKFSPIVEMLSKRLKATSKKIVRSSSVSLRRRLYDDPMFDTSVNSPEYKVIRRHPSRSSMKTSDGRSKSFRYSKVSSRSSRRSRKLLRYRRLLTYTYEILCSRIWTDTRSGTCPRTCSGEVENHCRTGETGTGSCRCCRCESQCFL